LRAIDLLNQAVAHDPAFFHAFCQLAKAHEQLYLFDIDRTPARLALAEEAVQAALGLRPDAGEAHLARAENLYMAYRDYDGALAELATASQTLPNDPGILALKGAILRRQGKQEEALQNLRHAVELDPLNFSSPAAGCAQLRVSSTLRRRKGTPWIARLLFNLTMYKRKS
jgi:tetratricopeptide (TPR) repeat protein